MNQNIIYVDGEPVTKPSVILISFYWHAYVMLVDIFSCS